MDQSEQRKKPSELTGLPGNSEELMQSQQMNILSSLAATLSPPSRVRTIVRKPYSEPVPDLAQAAAPRELAATIQSQITPRQSVGVIAPIPQPVDQLQISSVPSMQDTSSDVKASPDVDERRSRTPFTEEGRVVRTHAHKRVIHASHIPIQPQSTALVEDQQQDIPAVEQEVRHEEQAPPIHVSIGRVDVRVSLPLTTLPPVVKPAPRPALSLNDYLAQRRKGVQ